MHRAPRWLGLAAGVLAVTAGCSSTSTPAATSPSGASSATVTAGPAGSATATTPAAATGTTAIAAGFPPSFVLTSTAFTADGPIPQMYSCQGSAGSPPLAWTGVPAGTTSLALVVVDPDAPAAGGFTHWVLPNIDPSTTSLPAASTGYTPPCPPAGSGHHYHFTLYAFSAAPSATDRAGIEGAGNVVGKTELTGIYARQ
jgi:phosphatidylethanolamine-binding protein (PEBP) family uncharacterized protein